MPWKETCVMDQKVSFIVDWRRLVMTDEVTMTELCRRYDVSRTAGYALTDRFTAEGWDGLQDRGRAPHSHPNATSADVETAIVAERQAHPSWGAKKILARLQRREPEATWPAVSTISAILDRRGLVVHRRAKRRTAPWPSPLSPCLEANDVWGIDFKGWFKTGDGERCDPLSLSDLTTRYVLRLQAVERPDGAHVWALLDAAFREFGLPRMMRSDNGPPFASSGPAGLSWLAVRLIKVGVTPERIQPGKPQQNGRHERLHLTVKTETAAPPATSLRAQQRRFDAFRRAFNEDRPHEALGQVPPASVYSPSPRTYDGRQREPEYDATGEVRRVRSNGEIKWAGSRVFISEALIGEPLQLCPCADGSWRLRYADIDLGCLDRKGVFTARKTGARPRLAPQPMPPG